ncbi:dTMP kinase [Pseudanabaena sp. FACHB-2040]|uniref:dTMP kinase n=1 Tax=Pseudanabaena sp. FACHB-2040 TaxID=2692859 RepID=UPI0016828170|nr:dTMP kinase [Pseudanabaena sp. FACHB-2040]MBD2256913.1 dTMP kinase [Pseudanabaena sp. FACHB-2040]
MQGKLIVFEGIEGCGKSTQLQQLDLWLKGYAPFQALQARGLVGQVGLTREPGGTPLGASLRQILLGLDPALAIADRAELLMYAADRAQHVETLIRPALARGDWVLCDRFIDSTLAYQGYGRGLDLETIAQLNQIATGGLVPDLTLWLKLPAEAGLARTRQRGMVDRLEQAGLAFHQRVQEGFEQLALAHPERITAVDAQPEPTAVSQAIQQVVGQYIAQWYGDI